MESDLQLLRENCIKWSKSAEAKCGSLVVETATSVCIICGCKAM